MASLVELCNLALTRLGQEPVVDLTNTTNGKRCNRVWPMVRDEVLRADDWRFALARKKVAALSTAPVSTFNYEYPMPSGFIRLVAIQTRQPWSFEGGSILSNEESPLSILYVQQMTDPSDYPADVFSLMAWRLAIELSGMLTTTMTDVQNLQSAYLRALSQAIETNGRETPPARIPDGTWIGARISSEDYDYFGDAL